MKKYLAEMVGTMVLVLMGCGSAIFNHGCGTTAQVLTVAFAFGLSVVAMAYTIGGVSGCHINPAITLGVWLSKRMSGKDAAMYMVFQVIGAFIGSAILYAIVQNITAGDTQKRSGSPLESGKHRKSDDSHQDIDQDCQGSPSPAKYGKREKYRKGLQCKGYFSGN